MKTKIVVATVALIGAFLLIRERPAPMVKHIANVVSEPLAPPRPKANPREYLSATAPIREPAPINIRSIEETLTIDKKALKTRGEQLAYEKALQDRHMIATAAKVLTRLESPRSMDERLANQRERMDAALFLTRAIEWKQNPQSETVKRVVKAIVLDDLTTKTEDLELRKSLVADRIELFANLKAVDRNYAQQIQASATRDQSKKLIQFANNFYRLDDKRKN